MKEALILACGMFAGMAACGTPKTAENAALTTQEIVCLTAHLSEGSAPGAADLSLACGIAQDLEPVVSGVISNYWEKRAAIRAAH